MGLKPAPLLTAMRHQACDYNTLKRHVPLVRTTCRGYSAELGGPEQTCERCPACGDTCGLRSKCYRGHIAEEVGAQAWGALQPEARENLSRATFCLDPGEQKGPGGGKGTAKALRWGCAQHDGLAERRAVRLEPREQVGLV